MSERRRVLITGASGGIGKEFARIFARENFDVIAVARSQDKLEILKIELEQFGVQVQVVVQDLSVSGAGAAVFEQTGDVDVLVNNAGFGEYGSFVKTDWDKERRMIDLNIKALTELCDLYVKGMVDRGHGKIMNVASTAAFFPGPNMAVYFATKAYVLSFSEALSVELDGTGVSVSALCPGPTRSDFQKNASMEGESFARGNLPSSQEVAEYGYASMMKGDVVAVHGWRNRFMIWSNRFVSRAMMRRILKRMMK